MRSLRTKQTRKKKCNPLLIDGARQRVVSLGSEEEITLPYRKLEGKKGATCMETEESQNNMSRKEGAMIACITKRKLSQPMEY